MALYLLACSPGNFSQSTNMNNFEDSVSTLFPRTKRTSITRLTYLIDTELTPKEIIAKIAPKIEMDSDNTTAIYCFAVGYPLAVRAKEGAALPIYEQALEDLYNRSLGIRIEAGSSHKEHGESNG